MYKKWPKPSHKWPCLIRDAWTISVHVRDILYNLTVVQQNPPRFDNGLGFMAPINSNNILIYSYQIWVVSSVHVGNHVQVLKIEMPPSCIPFVLKNYKEKKTNICWMSMLPFKRSTLNCKIDQKQQPTEQYATITQSNPGGKKWAIEEAGYKSVLCETVDANEIGIGTDHSTSISGSSPCLAINNKTKEASINLEDKKTGITFTVWCFPLLW